MHHQDFLRGVLDGTQGSLHARREYTRTAHLADMHVRRGADDVDFHIWTLLGGLQPSEQPRILAHGVSATGTDTQRAAHNVVVLDDLHIADHLCDEGPRGGRGERGLLDADNGRKSGIGVIAGWKAAQHDKRARDRV